MKRKVTSAVWSRSDIIPKRVDIQTCIIPCWALVQNSWQLQAPRFP
jgi:hypothetical protein